LDLRKIEGEVMKRQMQEVEDERAMIEEKFESQTDQINKLTSKLEKLWTKYKSVREDIHDLQSEFQQEREILLDDLREVNRVLKLKNMIINHFIPSSEIEKIEQIAIYDSNEDEWYLPTSMMMTTGTASHNNNDNAAVGAGSSFSRLLVGRFQEDENNDRNNKRIIDTGDYKKFVFISLLRFRRFTNI
jgi:predicted nuclease with TOPRIM domain